MATEETKSIKDFELEKGVIIHGDINVQKKVTESEFEQMIHDGSTGVNFEDRTAYLKSKGIKVTRQSLIDTSL
jgi:hypothetical protein